MSNAVRFDKRWFNPLYFILNDLIKDPTIRTILVYGGKSSSKTVSIAQLLTKECYINNSNTIAFRKESTIIKTTLKKSFILSLDTTRLFPAFEPLEFIFRCSNGGEIVLKGLDYEEKAKGIESYKYLYLDELNHFSKEEFQQFNLSLRGIPGQKIFASWNPVSENSWVKKELIDTYKFVDTEHKLPCKDSFVKKSTCGKVVLIKTTYEDNYWIVGSPCRSYGYRDDNLISEYTKLLTTDANSYRVNVLGEWGIRKSGGEFWKQFNEMKHIKAVVFNPATTVHISLDENVNPYVTQTIWQVLSDRKQINQIHEILSKSPDNNAPKAALQAVKWLRSIDYKDIVFIYGDPSASRRSTVDENSASFYDKYIEVLNKEGFRTISRVGKSHPEVALSASFINDIYESNLSGWNISISSSCYQSIEDYLLVKEDAEGKMLKVKEKDKETGVTFEPNGHCSDSLRYFIVKILESEFNQYKAKTSKIFGYAV